MFKKLTTSIGFLIASVGLALMPSTALADVTVALSPSLFEFGVDPGATFAETIMVSNEGEDAAFISVEVGPYGDGGENTTAVPWLRAEPDEFELQPGTDREVTVSVKVPRQTEPGGRYATVFFHTSPLSLTGTQSGFVGGTGVGVQIGSVFLLTVRGEGLRLEGRLERVVPVAAGPGRIMTRVEITNTGNVHMFPEGEVELKDEDGNVVGHFTLPETAAILPGETKSFYLEGAKSVPDGDYQASGSIQYGWDEDQIAAAEVEPEEWEEQESSRDITFNSVPKLRVVEVRMEGSSESEAEVTLAVENYGDVEVTPAGFLDILNGEGERAALLNPNPPKDGLGDSP